MLRPMASRTDEHGRAYKKSQLQMQLWVTAGEGRSRSRCWTRCHHWLSSTLMSSAIVRRCSHSARTPAARPYLRATPSTRPHPGRQRRARLNDAHECRRRMRRVRLRPDERRAVAAVVEHATRSQRVRRLVALDVATYASLMAPAILARNAKPAPLGRPRKRESLSLAGHATSSGLSPASNSIRHRTTSAGSTGTMPSFAAEPGGSRDTTGRLPAQRTDAG